ncbi:MAG: TIGR02266 family protein [Deltaproteobacteria bacterium]|nr:TIGR02266 family protein [Deltaproteobacteria bacterium]
MKSKKRKKTTAISTPSSNAAPAPASAAGRPKRKRGAPSVITFLKRVGGTPRVENTPAKGLLGAISPADLAAAGRLDADDENTGFEVATVVAELGEPVGRFDHLDEISADDALAAERINRARAQIASLGRRDRETRDAARIEVELPVEFHNAGRVEVDLASNISLRGAFVRTATPLDVGDPLLLTFDVPGSRFPLQVAARVRWVTAFGDPDSGRPGMGVEFIALDDRKRSALEQLLLSTHAGEVK